MKKIDFHIHTLATASDAHFDFDLDTLKQYVTSAQLDAIAITNHNLFDRNQFELICETLSITVLPGIEVDLTRGHVLVIGDAGDLADFTSKTERLSQLVAEPRRGISVADLTAVLGDMARYLVIPHLDKDPAVRGEVLQELLPYVSSGEVDSPKKFIRAIKDDSKPTPVLFSDVRVSVDLTRFPTRHTFVDCGDITLAAIKQCLTDKGKVALSASDGNRLFPVFSDGQMLSTGLNVLFGERSSGKTYTLDRIEEAHRTGTVKYIRQFSLVQHDTEQYERDFDREVRNQQSRIGDEYLSGFKTVLDDVMGIDLGASDRQVQEYAGSLLKSAEEADRRDAFSKARLFNEPEFPVRDDTGLSDLIESVRHLIENVEYREIIDRHLEIANLKMLACELIELLWKKRLDSRKRTLVNELVKDIKDRLKLRTAAVQIEDVDLYRVAIEKKKVARFCEIVKWLRQRGTIQAESIQGFKVVAGKAPYGGAGELRAAASVKTAFRDAFNEYDHPYEYLRALIDKDDLPKAELYRLFVKISYSILNRDGYPVSGGERSEFRLLQQIKDAQNYDILLIDEPESSFDNLFLKSDVNEIIKRIADAMPVVVVTHNNTVGASAAADYQLYASKEKDGEGVVYRLYSGYPTDRELTSVDGAVKSNYAVTLNSLEAGSDAYKDRRAGYEAIEH